MVALRIRNSWRRTSMIRGGASSKAWLRLCRVRIIRSWSIRCYEQTQLRALAAQFPEFAQPIASIITRLQDLLPVVRSAYRFPDFAFSNSIKVVAPGLAPGFGYDDLDDIADGNTAAVAFLQMATGRRRTIRHGCVPPCSPIASVTPWRWCKSIVPCWNLHPTLLKKTTAGTP